MPLDVIMPALGMAQDSGHLVAWHKSPGDEVAEGDVLFEVETDKATMEVEAQGAGYLTDVTAAEGTDVPVGQVIAKISDSPEGSGEAPAAAPAAEPAADAGGDGGDLPEGKDVIMPTLGMAQDAGQLVAWHKDLGDEVGEEDVLFEVETDKSVVEVPAGVSGYIAALLAEPGEDVPTGQTIAIVSAEKPENPVRRSAAAAAPAPAKAPEPEAKAEPEKKAPAPQQAKAPPKSPAPQADPGGKILASPKVRRLAMEEGLDLSRLVKAGYPQPYHVSDLETLRSLPADAATEAAAGGAAPARHLVAEIDPSALEDFVAWAGEAGLSDPGALLAGLAAAGLPGASGAVAVEAHGATRVFTVPAGGALGATEEAEAETSPDLLVRDLRGSPLTAVSLGPEAQPVLTLAGKGGTLSVTLECAASQLTASEAVDLLTAFAGRLDEPLRHLL
ncbi:biotin/lipoyl-containing protein [Histidinibacterium aquaticum]|uniref:Pyruvate dehydrogenase n=1 Tax=Histidinibacterium aquaticum TaxID=2613962 RepID=A0A5J5GG89_9RHOB|nr:biotin/lipoyl-containing protein [Histidinibacterium aquaticum]KAA9006762.1 pyruvate dehydrogenase [Histidinibacterium aquaticum]